MSNEKLDKLLVLGPASRDRRQMGPTLDLVIFDMPSVDGSPTRSKRQRHGPTRPCGRFAQSAGDTTILRPLKQLLLVSAHVSSSCGSNSQSLAVLGQAPASVAVSR